MFMGQITAVINEVFCKDFIAGVDVTVIICEHASITLPCLVLKKSKSCNS
jgi:hypothetical protein